jgi:hypothetical protein
MRISEHGVLKYDVFNAHFPAAIGMISCLASIWQMLTICPPNFIYFSSKIT